MPIRLSGEQAAKVKYAGEDITKAFHPLSVGESENTKNALFQNTSPMVMLSVNNSNPSPGDTIVFTATVVDPEVSAGTDTLTYEWYVNDVLVKTTTGTSSLTDTYSYTQSGTGSADVHVVVSDSSGSSAQPIEDTETISFLEDGVCNISIGGISYNGATFNVSSSHYPASFTACMIPDGYEEGDASIWIGSPTVLQSYPAAGNGTRCVGATIDSPRTIVVGWDGGTGSPMSWAASISAPETSTHKACYKSLNGNV